MWLSLKVPKLNSFIVLKSNIKFPGFDFKINKSNKPLNFSRFFVSVDLHKLCCTLFCFVILAGCYMDEENFSLLCPKHKV